MTYSIEANLYVSTEPYTGKNYYTVKNMFHGKT